jgi:hypothetical protein
MVVGLRGCYRFRYYDLAMGRMVAGGTYENVVCQTGKVVLAQWLNGENPALGPIYGAVGTGTATTAATDIALGNELARVALASNIRSSNVVTMDFFFSSSQANGALTEAGLFLQASGGVNSGQLLSHVSISEQKTNTMTMTVEFQITIG